MIHANSSPLHGPAICALGAQFGHLTEMVFGQPGQVRGLVGKDAFISGLTQILTALYPAKAA